MLYRSNTARVLWPVSCMATRSGTPASEVARRSEVHTALGLGLHDLTGDERVFVEGIHRTESMVSVRNDDLAVVFHPRKQERRECRSRSNIGLILLDVRIADPQE